MNQKGQAIVEMALVTPVLLLLLVGTADVGTLVLRVNVAQGAVQAIAELEAQDAPGSAAVLTRAGCADGEVTITRVDPEVRVALRCPYVSLTSVLPSVIEVQATAVKGGAPHPSPAI